MAVEMTFAACLILDALIHGGWRQGAAVSEAPLLL
jgi:hypothetical protein